MSEAPVVRIDVEDGIGVITIDNPPVNALGPGVADGIIAAVAQGEADPNVKAMVLIGAGRSFIAGADIRQFGKPRVIPKRRSYDVVDDSSKPIVAATSVTRWAAGWNTPCPAITASQWRAPRWGCPKC